MPEAPRTLQSYFEGEVDPQRSRTMARIRGKDTGPELALRRAVHARGGRFRIHVRALPGRPDLASRRARVAVFVDGCFWHGCPRHYKPPRTRAAFWREKVRRNVAKRGDVLAGYADDWTVIQVFECDLREDLDGWAARVAAALRRA